MLLIELVGVVHGHPASLRLVVEKIREVKPDAVAVELCPLRLAYLKQAMREKAPISWSGPVPFLLSLVERAVQGITKFRPGAEMMMAVEEAKKLGAAVEPIDVDIRLTVLRLRTIPLSEKVKLLLEGLFSLPLLPFLLKGGGAEPEEVMARLRGKYPAMYRVLVEEREEYMAGKLRELSARYGKIVAVVGAAHVRGLRERLGRKVYRYEFRVESYWP